VIKNLNAAPRAGEPVDLAPLAWKRWWTGGEGNDLQLHDLLPEPDGSLCPGQDPATGEWHLGLEWDETRDIRRVVVQFAEAVPPNVRIEYWRKNWPTVAPERRAGARRGWIGRDDPFHGKWTTARGEATTKDGTYSFTFDPIDIWELGGRGQAEQLEEAQHFLARFRRTLKLRIVANGESAPRIASVQAFSNSLWCEGVIAIRFGVGNNTNADWSGQAEAYNGHVLKLEPMDFADGDTLNDDGTWRCSTSGGVKGLLLNVLYTNATEDADRLGSPDANDRTIMTVRTAAASFSFRVADLERGPIYIPDYGVFVSWADAAFDFAAYEAQRKTLPAPVYDRVESEPEQSWGRAIAEIPPLDVTKQEGGTGLGRYLPISVDAGRQEWAIRHNGEIFGDKGGLKLMGRDAAKLLWPGRFLRWRIGSGDPPDFRERLGATEQSILENWLPVIISRWLDREINYEEVAFAALIDGPMTPPDARRGDEDTVALLRFTVRNATHGRKRARLWLVVQPQEQLELRDDMVIAQGRVVPEVSVARQWRVEPYDASVLRCVIHTGGKGSLSLVGYSDQPNAAHAIPNAILYSVDLDGGESHVVTVAMPFPSFAKAADWARVAALDFDVKLADVVAYWKGYVESGGQMNLPDTILSETHKSVRTHVAISSDKDPMSGLIAVPAATYDYGVCANEACWQINMVDQAGHHDRAATYLETFLATQGMSRMDGNFVSTEGVMQGLDFDAGVPHRSGFAYNLDPGFIMETLVDHYRLTADRAWLERVASKLVAACDFIIRERERTKTNNPDGSRSLAWGLLPAGHLEDNPEWRHWFAVNAHAYNGLRGIASILEEIDHADAQRLTDAAAAYREDIRQAARRAMIEAPVVRLLDGTYIPHVPTRTGIRGREWGWFREAAYGAAHLLEGNVFDPDEPEMTWVLKDLEDNLFISRDWGRPVDLERFWFSQGGVSIQANLMDTAIDWLRRGQIKHGLRALYNNFAASLYRDVRCFTEHPVVELGHGVGPHYKSSDEAKALVWLRAFLVHEQETAFGGSPTLHLARGAARAWFAPGQSFGVSDMASWFGPVTYKVTADADTICAVVTLDPTRKPPLLALHIRPPEGRKAQSVTVNGDPHEVTGEVVRIKEPPAQLQVCVTLT
jgi:hypothetical protein